MKRCPKCGRKKRLTLFFKNKTTEDSLTRWCASCCKKSFKKWRSKNRDVHMKMVRGWHKKNYEEYRRKAKEWSEKTYRNRKTTYYLPYRLKTRYGLSLEEYTKRC